VRESVCVKERERERDRACVLESSGCLNSSVHALEMTALLLHGCKFVRARERVCVCVRERERACVFWRSLFSNSFAHALQGRAISLLLRLCKRECV